MRLRYFFTLSIVFVLFSGCSEDFDVTTEWQDIPVVFAILSPVDTAHYIRVEKAFLDPVKNAFEMAKVPDSIYYKNLDVQLQDISTGQFYQLNEVDGNLEGYPRQEGPFAGTPNILYKIRASDINLVGGNDYKLIINRGDEKPLVSATTRLVSPFRIFSPMSGSNMRISDLSNNRINWEKLPSAYFFDVQMDIYIREINAQQGTNIIKKLTWQIASRNTLDRVNFQGPEFFNFLAANLEENNAISRVFDHLDIRVTGGGQELFDYINIIIANSGITATQEVPTYTNLSEGFGIFSSRIAVVNSNINLTAETINDLKDNEATKGLGFL